MKKTTLIRVNIFRQAAGSGFSAHSGLDRRQVSPPCMPGIARTDAPVDGVKSRPC